MKNNVDSMEELQPFRNVGGIKGIIRHIFDLQECSTWKGIVPYINRITRSKRGCVLDVGCGAKPYRHLFPNNWKYNGLDIKEANDNFKYNEHDVTYYDGENFPYRDNTFDLLFHSEVMEHVPDTTYFINECYRVLKKGGGLLFTVPFQARYHYIPFDYYRFTPSGIRKLLGDAGYKEIEIVPRGTDICVAAYKLLTIGYRLFFSKNMSKMLYAILFAPVWIVSLLVGQLSLWTKIGSDKDCLGYIVYCKK